MKFGINSLAWESPFGKDAYGQFKKAKDFGFDIYEIAVEDFSIIDTEDVKAAIAKSGIEVATLCGAFGDTRDISSDNPKYREIGVQYIKDLVDFAVAIGAKVIAGPLYSAVGKARMISAEEKAQQWDWAVENLKLLADYAAPKGIKLAIEPLNRFETDFINTAAQAQDLIARINRENVGYMLDTFHMNIEESNIPAAIRLAKEKLFTLHTCANDRGTPGKDNFDWKAINQALKDIHYDAYCVIESFTPNCIEIAKAASVWRPFAESPEALASDGLAFLKKTLV
ncbi:MAG: sugar phosphate isomerase/epimerase family protein [Christensenellaceae bacterium]